MEKIKCSVVNIQPADMHRVFNEGFKTSHLLQVQYPGSSGPSQAMLCPTLSRSSFRTFAKFFMKGEDLMLKTETVSWSLRIPEDKEKRPHLVATLMTRIYPVSLIRQGIWGNSAPMSKDSIAALLKQHIDNYGEHWSDPLLSVTSIPECSAYKPIYVAAESPPDKSTTKTVVLTDTALAVRWGLDPKHLAVWEKAAAKVIADQTGTGWEFRILSGSAITYAYFNCVGGTSCMAGPKASRFTEFYANNPNCVKLAVMYHAESGCTSRALIWFSRDNKVYLDRMYPAADTNVRHALMLKLLKGLYGEKNVVDFYYRRPTAAPSKDHPVFVMTLPLSRRTSYLDTMGTAIKPCSDTREVWLSSGAESLEKFAKDQGYKLKDSQVRTRDSDNWVGHWGIIGSAYGDMGGPWAVRRMTPEDISEPPVSGMEAKPLVDILAMAEVNPVMPTPPKTFLEKEKEEKAVQEPPVAKTRTIKKTPSRSAPRPKDQFHPGPEQVPINHDQLAANLVREVVNEVVNGGAVAPAPAQAQVYHGLADLGQALREALEMPALFRDPDAFLRAAPAPAALVDQAPRGAAGGNGGGIPAPIIQDDIYGGRVAFVGVPRYLNRDWMEYAQPGAVGAGPELPANPQAAGANPGAAVPPPNAPAVPVANVAEQLERDKREYRGLAIRGYPIPRHLQYVREFVEMENITRANLIRFYNENLDKLPEDQPVVQVDAPEENPQAVPA